MSHQSRKRLSYVVIPLGPVLVARGVSRRQEPENVTQNLQAHEFPVGHIFEGKYKILRELGRGGFGMVYLGYQESMDRQVALKVLKGGATGEHAGARERFIREVKIIAKLKHPNTVTIHEFGETADGALYMVLEFVEGEELKQTLKRDGAVDPLRVCNVARQISKSLGEAHRHGVVHRDLKPANIMLTRIEGEQDFVKVLDFGVARLLDPKTADLTSVGLPEGERELIGTPRYMSPEQVRGESLTGSSDIYSLGLIMYEMLIGEPAVQGDTTMALITQQISPEPLRLWGLEHHDPLIQDIVRIATSKALTDRFQTAEQMGDALEQAIFNIRRARNLTGSGSGSGDYGSPFQTGHGQFQQGAQQFMDPTGFNPSGWNPDPSRTPSGNYQGTWEPGNSFDPRASQQPGWNSPNSNSGQWNEAPQQNVDPRSTGQGVDPRSTGQGFDPRSTGQGVDPRQSNPGFSGPHGQPQQGSPASHQSGIEIDVDDFQPTVERNALSNDQLPSFSELPPVRDENPFAEAEPEPKPEPAKPPPNVMDDEDLVGYSIDIIKILVLSLTTTIGVYTSFIMIGAAMVEILDDRFLRLVATGVLCAGIPLFTALGENSQKERFRVLERPRDRVIRVLIGTTIFSVAAGFLISVALATTVIRELRSSPNWFLDPETTQTDEGLVELNRKMSYMTADAAEWTASALGVYSATKADAPPLPRTPAPTRNKLKPKPSAETTDTQGKDGWEEPSGEGSAADDGSGSPEADRGTERATESSDTPSDSAPDSPGPADDQPAEEDDDYVRW